MVDNIQKTARGKSYIQRLRIIYKDELKGNEGELDNKTPKEATMMVMKRFSEQYLKIPTTVSKFSPTGGSNSEIVADEFATKFGLGVELVTGLNRFYVGSKSNNLLTNVLADNQLILNVFMFNVVLVVATAMPMVVSYVFVYFVGGYYYMKIALDLLHLIVLGRLLQGGHSNDGSNPYEDLKDRYTRIRQTMINTLRHSDMPSSETRKHIKNIEKIGDIIDNTYKERDLNIFRMLSSILPLPGVMDHKLYESAKDLDRTLAALQDNNMYVTSKKLKST